MDKMENILRKIYYDPKSNASFGGVDKRYRAAKSVSSEKLTRKDIRDWLRSQAANAYTVHKPTRKSFSTQQSFCWHQFESDLCDFQSLATFNDNYRFLLVCLSIASNMHGLGR